MKPADKELVVSYLTLRQMIGWIGLIMPFLVRIGAREIEHISGRASISAYYYTGMHDVFVSTLVLIGVLLTCYRTPARRDRIAAVGAGLAGIGIGLFPMDPNFDKSILARFPNQNDKCYIIHGQLGFHMYFVMAFFAICIYLIYFRFDAFGPEIPGHRKILRNRIYKGCGAVMAIACVGIVIAQLTKSGLPIFWPETLAVVAFAVAWLVKGQTILKDTGQASA